MSNVVTLREHEDSHRVLLPAGEDAAPRPDAQGELLPEVMVDVDRLLVADADMEVEVPDKKWGKLLRAMVAHYQAAFMRAGHDEVAARRLSRVAILALSEYGGGKYWYLPRGDEIRVALRDIELFRRANRDNLEALADEYRLSMNSVYRILREQGRLHAHRRQGQLVFASAP